MIRDAVNELALAQWGDNYQNIVNNLVAQGARACFFGDGNTKITKEGQICDGARIPCMSFCT
jgi:hypothetical protein